MQAQKRYFLLQKTVVTDFVNAMNRNLPEMAKSVVIDVEKQILKKKNLKKTLFPDFVELSEKYYNLVAIHFCWFYLQC